MARRDAGARHLSAFVEHIAPGGFVARTIHNNGIRGFTVAAPAPC
jgi:hypothetical protein